MVKSEDVQHRKQQVQLNPAGSASSSPSHEFSFTSAAIDLSPADEIFFHGHLLPLHLLSHFPVSPRSSTNSLDSFTLPISSDSNIQNNNDDDESRHVLEGKGRGKSKSFSLFAMPKWGKERELGHEQSQKRKSRFELLKRYVRFVKPFLSLRGRRGGTSDEFLRQQPYSYSGNLRVRKKMSPMRGRRGEFSAPASMTTSPANSGLLVATPTGKSDSTMEELQAAIQAAIAHCKKSIAAEDNKIKLHP